MPSAHIRALLRTAPIVDGHNDLPWALRDLVDYDLSRVDLEAGSPDTHTDWPRLRAGGVGGQFWSVFVPGTIPPVAAVTATFEQIDAVHDLVRRYPRQLVLATTADDVRDAWATGRIASLLGAEGGHSIANSLGTLRMMHALGVRYLTLTHNQNNDWADSGTDEPRHGGLSDFGRDVVREMNRIGMLVDLSHVAATTMSDALDVSMAPVLFSHSSARAVTDTPRNVPDEILTRMAAGGGACLVTFVPRFVSQHVLDWHAEATTAAEHAGVDIASLADYNAFVASYAGSGPLPHATLEDVVAHCEHIREVAGIDHIGIGGDYDGVPDLPMGLEDVSCYPRLLQALADRGWSDIDLTKLTSGNVLRVLDAAAQVAGELRHTEPIRTRI